MKILKEPINIYEVTVSQSVSVTYHVHAKNSDNAVEKALNSWDKISVELQHKEILEQNPESIECIEKDVYSDI